MYYFRHKILFSLLLYIVGITCPLAAVQNSSVSPGSSTIGIGGAATIILTWQVVISANTPPGPDTVISPGGIFIGSNLQPLVSGNSRRLSQTIVVPPPLNVNPPVIPTVSFTEAVSIPQSVIYRAQKAGSSRFTYQRTFSDSSAPGINVTASAVIDIGGAASGPLDISRIALKFDDLSVARITGRDEELYVTADVSYTGTGLLDAVWEVAPVSSSSRSPVFFPITTIRQYLSSGGLVVLQSPPMPTSKDGLYFVRLRVRGITILTDRIQFEVQGYISGEPSEPPEELFVSSPAAASTLSADTEFTWDAVPNARAYQLELYRHADEGTRENSSESQSEQPVTGVLVPGTQAKLKLSALTRKHLRAGQTYRWRVIAIGGNGRVVAVSSSRRIDVNQRWIEPER